MIEKDKILKEPVYTDGVDPIAYDNSVDKYYKKQLRDKLRKELAEAEVSFKGTSLYCFDGKSETISASGVLSLIYSNAQKDYPTFMSINLDDVKKVKISGLTEISCAELLEKTFSKKAPSALSFAEKNKSIKIPGATSRSCTYTQDGTAYYLKNIEKSTGMGSLYIVTENKEKEISKNVGGFAVLDTKTPVYFTDVKKGIGELIAFYRGKSVVLGKAVNSDIIKIDNENLWFIDNYNGKTGALMLFKNGESTVVAQGVQSFADFEDAPSQTAANLISAKSLPPKTVSTANELMARKKAFPTQRRPRLNPCPLGNI